jgi:hypothetical protein
MGASVRDAPLVTLAQSLPGMRHQVMPQWLLHSFYPKGTPSRPARVVPLAS